MRRCYIDCTNTLYTGLNTGIQRVVRNIVSRCSGDRHGLLVFVPVFASYGKFYRFDDISRNSLIATNALNSLLGGMRNIVDRLFNFATYEEKSADEPFAGKDQEFGTTLHARTIRKLRKLVPFLLHCAFLVDRVLIRIKPIHFRQGDVLFLADALWDPVLIDALKRGPFDETLHLALIYDISPVTHPQFFLNWHANGFLEHLPFIFKWADGIVSISRSSLDEIKNYGSKAGYRPLYEYFHLGADFKDETPEPGSVRTHIRDIFAGDASFLMVGTIEPRKNHRYVLETFKRMWEQGADARLCIVGRIGWKCRETLEAIYTNPHYNKNLFFIADATDAELNYCYSQARAVIISSFAEGFGLPLVEALHFGKKVFASDIPVFREVGNGFPVFFSLDRTADLQDKILNWKDGMSSAGSAPYQALSWDESIAGLFEKITRMVGSIDHQRHLSYDAQRNDA